jgi:phosphoglycolate phosphatase-like HAD superfamily hydrolase
MSELSSLIKLVEGKQQFILDMDGPLIHLFKNRSAPEVAKRVYRQFHYALSRIIPQFNIHLQLYPEIPKSDDPFEALRWLNIWMQMETFGKESKKILEDTWFIVVKYHDLLVKEEIMAASCAPFAPGLNELLKALDTTGRKMSVATNNDFAAIMVFLHRFEKEFGWEPPLIGALGRTVSRNSHKPVEMKPSPFILGVLSGFKKVKRSACLYIGDSLSDAQTAGHEEHPLNRYGFEKYAGLYPFLGYTGFVDNPEERTQQFKKMKVPSIHDYALLTEAVLRTPLS